MAFVTMFEYCMLANNLATLGNTWPDLANASYTGIASRDIWDPHEGVMELPWPLRILGLLLRLSLEGSTAHNTP
jgi:hypothetical protein